MFGKSKQLETRINERKRLVNDEKIHLAKYGKQEYETGLYNGLELGLAIMENIEPMLEIPDQKPEEKEQDKGKGRTMYGNMKRTYKKEG